MNQQTISSPDLASKSTSTKPSITGGVFSILAIATSGIAYFLTHVQSRSHTEVTTAVGKVSSGPVAKGASNAVTGILSMPFIFLGVVFALLALFFTVARLKKVKAGGMVLSIVWILVSVWALRAALAAFQTY